jgi:hypothetical protein
VGALGTGGVVGAAVAEDVLDRCLTPNNNIQHTTTHDNNNNK